MKYQCPICKAPAESTVPDFPFCSERCRLLDLGNWAAEKYVVSEPIFSEDDDELREERGHQDQPDHNDHKH